MYAEASLEEVQQARTAGQLLEWTSAWAAEWWTPALYVAVLQRLAKLMATAARAREANGIDRLLAAQPHLHAAVLHDASSPYFGAAELAHHAQYADILSSAAAHMRSYGGTWADAEVSALLAACQPAHGNELNEVLAASQGIIEPRLIESPGAWSKRKTLDFLDSVSAAAARASHPLSHGLPTALLQHLQSSRWDASELPMLVRGARTAARLVNAADVSGDVALLHALPGPVMRGLLEAGSAAPGSATALAEVGDMSALPAELHAALEELQVDGPRALTAAQLLRAASDTASVALAWAEGRPHEEWLRLEPAALIGLAGALDTLALGSEAGVLTERLAHACSASLPKFTTGQLIQILVLLCDKPGTSVSGGSLAAFAGERAAQHAEAQRSAAGVAGAGFIQLAASTIDIISQRMQAAKAAADTRAEAGGTPGLRGAKASSRKDRYKSAQALWQAEQAAPKLGTHFASADVVATAGALAALLREVDATLSQALPDQIRAGLERVRSMAAHAIQASVGSHALLHAAQLSAGELAMLASAMLALPGAEPTALKGLLLAIPGAATAATQPSGYEVGALAALCHAAGDRAAGLEDSSVSRRLSSARAALKKCVLRQAQDETFVPWLADFAKAMAVHGHVEHELLMAAAEHAWLPVQSAPVTDVIAAVLNVRDAAALSHDVAWQDAGWLDVEGGSGDEGISAALGMPATPLKVFANAAAAALHSQLARVQLMSASELVLLHAALTDMHAGHAALLAELPRLLSNDDLGSPDARSEAGLALAAGLASTIADVPVPDHAHLGPDLAAAMVSQQAAELSPLLQALEEALALVRPANSSWGSILQHLHTLGSMAPHVAGLAAVGLGDRVSSMDAALAAAINRMGPAMGAAPATPALPWEDLMACVQALELTVGTAPEVAGSSLRAAGSQAIAQLLQHALPACLPELALANCGSLAQSLSCSDAQLSPALRAGAWASLTTAVLAAEPHTLSGWDGIRQVLQYIPAAQSVQGEGAGAASVHQLLTVQVPATLDGMVHHSIQAADSQAEDGFEELQRAVEQLLALPDAVPGTHRGVQVCMAQLVASLQRAASAGQEHLVVHHAPILQALLRRMDMVPPGADAQVVQMASAAAHAAVADDELPGLAAEDLLHLALLVESGIHWAKQARAGDSSAHAQAALDALLPTIVHAFASEATSSALPRASERTRASLLTVAPHGMMLACDAIAGMAGEAEQLAGLSQPFQAASRRLAAILAARVGTGCNDMRVLSVAASLFGTLSESGPAAGSSAGPDDSDSGLALPDAVDSALAMPMLAACAASPALQAHFTARDTALIAAAIRDEIGRALNADEIDRADLPVFMDLLATTRRKLLAQHAAGVCTASLPDAIAAAQVLCCEHLLDRGSSLELADVLHMGDVVQLCAQWPARPALQKAALTIAREWLDAVGTAVTRAPAPRRVRLDTAGGLEWACNAAGKVVLLDGKTQVARLLSQVASTLQLPGAAQLPGLYPAAEYAVAELAAPMAAHVKHSKLSPGEAAQCLHALRAVHDAQIHVPLTALNSTDAAVLQAVCPSWTGNTPSDVVCAAAAAVAMALAQHGPATSGLPAHAVSDALNAYTHALEASPAFAQSWADAGFRVTPGVLAAAIAKAPWELAGNAQLCAAADATADIARAIPRLSRSTLGITSLLCTLNKSVSPRLQEAGMPRVAATLAESSAALIQAWAAGVADSISSPVAASAHTDAAAEAAKADFELSAAALGALRAYTAMIHMASSIQPELTQGSDARDSARVLAALRSVPLQDIASLKSALAEVNPELAAQLRGVDLQALEHHVIPAAAQTQARCEAAGAEAP